MYRPVPPSIRISRIFYGNNTPYTGKNRNNTEDKSAQEGVASITTNGQVQVSTGKATQNTGKIICRWIRMTLELTWRL